MNLIGKIRGNFLNQKHSFNIGFGNRSPFSYASKYSSPKGGYFRIPTISSSPSDWYDPTATQALYKQQENIMKIGEAAGKLASHLIEKRKQKKEEKDLQERATQEEYNPAKGVMQALNLTGNINKP